MAIDLRHMTNEQLAKLLEEDAVGYIASHADEPNASDEENALIDLVEMAIVEAARRLRAPM